jgi:asparagine N-glycosylation enzyme membrane subunit Stt3
MELLPEAWGLVSVQLYAADGIGTRLAPPLSRFRLIDESRVAGAVPFVKAFERVRGAMLHITAVPPGSSIHVAVPVRTRLGRTFAYETSVVAGANGSAWVRVPYSSGRNGQTIAGEYVISADQQRVQAVVSDEDVLIGRELVIALR